MSFLDEIREEFGVARPTRRGAPGEVGNLQGIIERGLRIGQGETFKSVPLSKPGGKTGLDQLISEAGPEWDTLRGIVNTGIQVPGLHKLFGTDKLNAPQRLVEPRVEERGPDNPGDWIDKLQEGTGIFAPLILGSGIAAATLGAAVPLSGAILGLGSTAMGATGTALGVSATGGLGAFGFQVAENILTGMEADALLDQPIAEGIAYSAAGTAFFGTLGALFKATGALPKFVTEHASDLQKNYKLRQLAQQGIDPRGTDLTNQFTQAGKAIDEVTGGATQLEKEFDLNIWGKAEGGQVGATRNVTELLNSQRQFNEEILDQRNLTEILNSRMGGEIEAKTTATADVGTLDLMSEALEKIGMRPTGILDRVSPTVSIHERLAVINANIETFREGSKRMGTPDKVIEEVIAKATATSSTPAQLGERLMVSLEEQAQIGMLQNRLDVVNPAFNGVDAVAKQFFELDVEARKDIMQVMRAFGLETSDKKLAKSLMAFDRRLQEFFGGAEKVDPFVKSGVDKFVPTLPKLPQPEGQLEADVLRGVARTAPSTEDALGARTGTLNGVRDTIEQPHSTGNLGLPDNVGNSIHAKRLANGIPLPIDAVEASAIRQTLFDIADLYYKNKPELALQAVHALKQFDLAQKEFANTFSNIGIELHKLGGPLADFVKNRYSLQSTDFLGNRLSLSKALEGGSMHYPELSERVIRDIFNVPAGTKVRSVIMQSDRLGKHAKGLGREAKRASFEFVQRHEFGHELHKALKLAGGNGDGAAQHIVETIEKAVHFQPYRNDDLSFRKMTGQPMGERNGWVKPHGTPLNEAVAELISNMGSKEGQKHIHPKAREVLEEAGILFEPPYTPNRPAFQFGTGDNIGSGVGNFDPPPSMEDITKTLSDASPAPAPSAAVAGNAQVGPRKLDAQRAEVHQNAIAALTTVSRVGGGPEKQLGLFSGLADEGLSMHLPSKEVRETLATQLEGLGASAVQAFNESLITLPRSAQGKFVKRFIEEGEGVLGRSITDYTKALREWRASAMLFGPSTWMANIFSTMLNSSIRPLTTLTASGLDAARVAAFGGERTSFATEAIAQIAGIMQGARDGLNFIKSDVQRLRGMAPPAQTDLQQLFETGTILRQGGFRESIMQGSDSAFLFAKGTKTGKVAGKVGTGIQVPFQILRLSDNAMFNMNFTGEMYRLAAKEARKAGKDFDLKEIGRIVAGKGRESASLRSKAAAFAEDEMAKSFGEGYKATDGSLPIPLKALQDDMIQKALLDSVPQDIKTAKMIAEKSIFVAREAGQLDKFLTKVDEVDELLGGAISLAAPFRRTPADIIREGIRTSPLGFITTASETIGQLVGTVPKTTEELVEAYAQATVGTALYASFTALAYYGVIEGNPTHFEQNRAVRTTYLADGRLPETVFMKVPGGRVSIPLSRLQPIGGLILGALRASEVVKDEGLKTLRPDILFGTQMQFIKSLGLQDQVEGTSDLLEAIISDDPRINFAERFGGSFVPAFVRQGRQALGIEQGRASGPGEANALTRFAQGFQSGAFNSGLPKLGLFGETIKRAPVAGAAGIAQVGNDPTIAGLIDAGSFHQAPDLLPELRDGSAQDKQSFVKGKGMLQRQFVEQAMKIPNWQTLPQDRRKRIIDAAFTRASSIANTRGKNAIRAGASITPQLILTGKLGL